MALHMRDQLLKAVLAHANGEIAKHKANVEVYLEHPAGIGEHSDITEAIQVELDKIARYHDQIEVLNHYFLKRQMANISIPSYLDDPLSYIIEAIDSTRGVETSPIHMTVNEKDVQESADSTKSDLFK